MARWPTTLRIGAKELKLRVTSPDGDDVLRARLPVLSSHPRALLTLLEGVALWSGAPLHAAISASAQRDDWLCSEEWGDAFWPPESALVHFDFAIPPRVLRVGDPGEVRRCLRMARST